MLIRSQDKLQLINLENGTTAVDYRNKKNILFYDTGSVEPTSTIGKYSSEEKVIKVLDMVQAAYESSCYCDHAFDSAAQVQRPYIFVRNEVFQMPQDDEVEV